jgi:transcription initiation factor TFIIIB Brf1 subunit/transcription initiation factor TFIIB
MSNEEIFNIFYDIVEPDDSLDKNDNCKHEQVINDSNSMICNNCGLEIYKIFSYEKEWKYYGDSDSNPIRCYLRRNDDKTIFKDIENFGFTENIVNCANDIFTNVTEGKIYRGNSRKAIIFACIFNACKMNDNIYSCDLLKELFKLDRKTILKGLKHVNLKSAKTKQNCKYITPRELIKEYSNKLKIPIEQQEEIEKLFEKIKNKSTLISRSRPQSIASSFIYYYISRKKGIGNYNIKDYTKTIKLSELTINKISKEIDRLI